MSNWTPKRCLIGAVAVLGLCQCMVGRAQELTPREKEMMALIESLQERVAILEEKAGLPDSEPVDPGLTERVEALERQGADGDGREPNEFRVFWNNGMAMETGDGQAKLKIGGRIHNDWFWFDQDKRLQRMVDLEDGVEFRRARLNLSGTLYENINFKTEYDFADGDAEFKDVYLELTRLPGVQNLRIGHFKEPFGLEELTSDNDITLMERSLPNVFAPSYNTGAMIHGAFLGEKEQERLTVALGIFRTADDYGNDQDDGGYSGTVRVSGLPWFAKDGRRLLHLGAAYTHRNPDGTLRIRRRPEAHGTDIRFVDTGNFKAEDIDSLAWEAALIYGSFSLQGEYFRTNIDTQFQGDRNFDGFYAQASYVLTGEHRPYRHGNGVFGRINPRKNFRIHGKDRGWGAWEVALRYSSIDLNDGDFSIFDQALRRSSRIRGGEEDNFTVGLNWYLNPNARIMWNYVHADLDSPVYHGDLNIFQTRFQLAF